MSDDQKRKILIVDDNDVFRGALKTTLESEGFDVAVAVNGRNAQEIVGLEDYAAVISDIRMTPVNGIELLHHIKRTSLVPVILMTGFSELMETQEAATLGADGFLAKPFKNDELIQLLRRLTKSEKEMAGKADAPADEDYCKISIEDFVSGHEIRYDLFIRVSEGKYLKIAHQGEDISIDRIKAYKSKGLTHLYMNKADFRVYIGFSLMLATAVKDNESVSKEKRINLLKHTGELVMQQIYSSDLEKDDFEAAKSVIETTVELLSESSDLFSLLSALNAHSDFLYAHSLGVSLYSVLIAKEMKWHSPANLYKISIGALLHDIGKKEIDRKILEKTRISLTASEVALLETHPMRGMEILSHVPSMPSDILQIVSQHHENCLGTGYPAHRTKNKIHPFARLIAAANEFCNLVIKGPDHSEISPKEAIQKMTSLYRENFDLAFLGALGRLFKIDVSASKKAA